MKEMKLFHSRRKLITRYNLIILWIFHCKILQNTDTASKALQSIGTDISNALKCLKICLEELENYRYELVNLKMKANSVT